MKFLIGVCGIGKGHSIREYEIAKELQNRGHDVKILTYGEGVKPENLIGKILLRETSLNFYQEL